MTLGYFWLVGAALAAAACGGSESGDDDAASGNGGAGGSAGTGGAQGGDGGSGLAASGGTAGLPATGGGAGMPASGGSGGSGAGGSSGSAGAGSGGSAAGGGEARGAGQVAVLTLVNYPSVGRSLTSVSARFTSPENSAAMPCAATTYGACKLYDCDPVPSTESLDAGSIIVRSDEVGFAHGIVRDSEGFYATYSSEEAVFLGEEAISVSAEGGEVPAFTAELRYPLLLLLTTPSGFDASYPYVFSPSQDLTLAWDRGATGVSLQLQSRSAASGDPALVCNLPSETGSLVVAKEALARLPSGTQFDLFTLGERKVVAGDYDVLVLAAGAVMAPDKAKRIELVLQ